MALDTDQILAYRRDGYVLIPSILDSAKIGELRHFVYRLYRKFQPDDDTLDDSSEPWNNIAFDQKMIGLRAHAPEVFGAESHKFKLNPPLSESVVKRFETKHKIRLPEDYRRFVSPGPITRTTATPGSTRCTSSWS